MNSALGSLFMIVSFLLSLLMPGIVLAGTTAGAETRVGGF